jgi:hypothetical protein
MVRVHNVTLGGENPDAFFQCPKVARPHPTSLIPNCKVKTWVSELCPCGYNGEGSILMGLWTHQHHRVAIGQWENHFHTESAPAGNFR